MKTTFVLGFSMAAIFGCTPASSRSHPTDSNSETEGDTNTESETDTATGFPGATLVLPTEDLLPDWTMSWAEAAGGSGAEAVGSISAAGADTLVAIGSTVDSEDLSEMISFDGLEVPVGPENMLLVEYDLDGKALWATWAGDGSYVAGRSVCALGSGRIAAAGWCSDNARFGPGEPNETWVLTGSEEPYDTAYFAMYEPDGALAWVRSLFLVDNPSPSPSSRSECLAMDLLEDGAVLATGTFDGEVVAGAGAPSETALVRDPDGDQFAYNAFVVKYDADGNLIWARSEGGPGKTVATGIAACQDGSFFLTGGFEGMALFGRGEANETALDSMGEKSVFVARYDAGGNLLWARDLGVDGGLVPWYDTGKPEVLSNGDVAIPGSFSGSMLAGNGDEVSPVSAETWGLFLARYSAEGGRVWTRVAPGNGDMGPDMGWFETVAELHDGMLVAAGTFNGTMVFGSGEASETTLQGNSNGLSDAILCAFSESGHFLWALPQGGFGYDFFWGLAGFTGETSESDILVVGGGFSNTVSFGTGGDDIVHLTAHESTGQYFTDMVLLRFDREGP